MLNNLQLKHRLWIALFLLWSVILICTVIGVQGLLSSHRSLTTIYEDKMKTVELIHQVETNFHDVRSHVFRAFQHDPSNPIHLLHDHAVSRHLNKIKDHRQDNLRIRNLIAERPLVPGEGQFREAFYNALDNWRAPLDRVVEQIGKDNYSNDVMFEFLTANNREGEDVIRASANLASFQAEQARLASVDAKEQLHFAFILFAVLYLALALPATLFILLALGRLSEGLTDAEEAVNAIAEGNLAHEIKLSGNDEMTRIKRQVQHMQLSLIDLIHGIQNTAHGVEEHISELVNSSNTLVDQNVQQSAALEQTSAATEELSSTVALNADNAAQADSSAKQALSAAEQGGQAMANVIGVMGEINEASDRIVAIVGIIDSIAFQTNILALNAAVESARAGEAGRGFAVVASEVRALAQRSAAAASDIKALVEQSMEVVSNGSNQVQDTGVTMDAIIKDNANLEVLIREIATSSNEQAIGLGQINEAMISMDHANHKTNELVAKNNDIAAELQNHSNHLLDLVASFNTRPSSY